MAQVQVRIVAESIITIDTDTVDQYEDIQDYLKGVDAEDATSKQLAVAMVRYDEETDALSLEEMEWKVLGVSTLD